MHSYPLDLCNFCIYTILNLTTKKYMTLFIISIIALIIINAILINNFDKKIKLSNKLYKSIQYNKNKKR